MGGVILALCRGPYNIGLLQQNSWPVCRGLYNIGLLQHNSWPVCPSLIYHTAGRGQALLCRTASHGGPHLSGPQYTRILSCLLHCAAEAAGYEDVLDRKSLFHPAHSAFKLQCWHRKDRGQMTRFKRAW